MDPGFGGPGTGSPRANDCRRRRFYLREGRPQAPFHPMAQPEFDIVVIGGGSGGLVVAAGGAALGAKVALVEKNRLGGDCLWYGCVPSKTLIKSARVAYQMRHADRWAITPASPHPDLARVMKRVADVIKGIEPYD